MEVVAVAKRPVWSGVLTFGLVTVPVGLYSAVDEHTIHFHQLQRGTSDRIRIRRVNERTGKEVANEDIVKGYEFAEGEYVVVEPQELEDIAPGRSQTIDVSGFVDLADVEPVYFATTYYLAPRGKEYTKVYELLRQAMEQTNRAGIATLVMRGKQYLTAVRAVEKVMVLHLLHWADEVRDPLKTLPDLPVSRAARGKELDSAVQLIEALAIDWKPEEYRDTYHEQVEQLVKAKAEGKEIVAAEEAPQATNVVDLMTALQRSIDQAGEKPAPRSARKGAGRAPRAKTAKSRPRATGSGARRRAGRESDLGRLSKDELYQRATRQQIPGRSKMTRDELIKALTSTKAA
ncbi:Ku protein [Streptomyces sp. URMC 127]|uniref:non-homologous end joining protein Ku n=1 Tax=Streptomyces sp. URMC 127 TaxID=3423402 RepID=UPI003F1A8BE8